METILQLEQKLIKAIEDGARTSAHFLEMMFGVNYEGQ